MEIIANFQMVRKGVRHMTYLKQTWHRNCKCQDRTGCDFELRPCGGCNGPSGLINLRGCAMKSFHQILVHFTIGIMVFGMVGVTLAAPIPKGHSIVNSYGKGVDPIKQGGKSRSKDSSGQGCWNRPFQATDGYSMALNEPYDSDCSSLMNGETAWIYAPGCTNLELTGTRMPSGNCSDDDPLVTNLGNLLVRSSDQDLGRIDVPARISGTENSLFSVDSVNQQESNARNVLSSPIPITIGIMVFGMVGVTLAAPIPKGHSIVNSYGKGVDPIKQGGKSRSKDSSGQGCWNRPFQATDGYSMALNEPYDSDCSSLMNGETAWIYAPGCTNLELTGTRMPSGNCSDDDPLVTNLGNLLVRSSDQDLGRIDVPARISGTENSLFSVDSVNQQESNARNVLSSPIQMSQAVLAKDFGFNRLVQDLLYKYTNGADGASLIEDFDHHWVMSGRLAHLVPKAVKGPRDLELGDLVFLLLFAMLPEKKQINHLFRGIRRLKIF